MRSELFYNAVINLVYQKVTRQLNVFKETLHGVWVDMSVNQATAYLHCSFSVLDNIPLRKSKSGVIRIEPNILVAGDVGSLISVYQTATGL
jgi:hypothetical protein